MTYEEQLKDERWIKLRNAVVQYDKCCRYCGSEDNLQVHHIKYLPSKMAWEHPRDLLLTLCRRCHEGQHRLGFASGSAPRQTKSIKQVMLESIRSLMGK